MSPIVDEDKKEVRVYTFASSIIYIVFADRIMYRFPDFIPKRVGEYFMS
jgi:hypothetical protein